MSPEDPIDQSPVLWPPNPEQGAAAEDGDSGFELGDDGPTDAQIALQMDLSCLVDGELDEGAAARVMVQLEESPECRSFFEDIQKFSQLHRDFSDTDRLEARIAMLGVHEIAEGVADRDLAHRLATIFYQLGKAYCLAGLDLDRFSQRVFESAVSVEVDGLPGSACTEGVNRVLDRVWGDVPGDALGPWPQDGFGPRIGARDLLVRRLEKIQDPVAKGRRLLEHAVDIDPSHEESRIYLAFLLGVDGKIVRAAELYREVFDTAMVLENRGHAAMQLGKLFYEEGDFRRALLLWRWISLVKLDLSDHRFALTHLNLGHAYFMLEDDDRSIRSYRRFFDRHLAHGRSIEEVAVLMRNDPQLNDLRLARPGFLSQMWAALPELLPVE